MKTKKIAENFIYENRNYKIVALLVSLVLWITILGRKDLVYTKEVDLQILLAPNHSLLNRVINKVNVKVKGSRLGLKKFMKSSESITLDLGKIQSGWSEVKIPSSEISLPIGVNVLSVSPEKIRVKVKKVSPDTQE